MSEGPFTVEEVEKLKVLLAVDPAALNSLLLADARQRWLISVTTYRSVTRPAAPSADVPKKVRLEILMVALI